MKCSIEVSFMLFSFFFSSEMRANLIHGDFFDTKPAKMPERQRAKNEQSVKILACGSAILLFQDSRGFAFLRHSALILIYVYFSFVLKTI